MIKSILVAGLLTVSSFGQAQQKIQFKEFKLENGLQVILHQDKTARLVAVSVLYHLRR